MKPLYETRLPISSDKMKNIIALAAFLKKPESVPFYQKFYVTESTTNIDLDEEDNSDGCE